MGTISLVHFLDFPHELPAFDNVEAELIPQSQSGQIGTREIAQEGGITNIDGNESPISRQTCRCSDKPG